MNRLSRTHRSTKIPNVKLRPAAAHSSATLVEAGSSSSSSRSHNKRARADNDLRDGREDDDHFRRMRDDGVESGAHVDADFLGTSAKPLKGAVISMTGLGEAKLVLAQYAREMGAQVEGNLTEDVTHLVAERPGSEKYICALGLGMHIVHPDWITEMRAQWLEGQDVDPEDLQDAYRLRPLEGTTIAFAGCSAAERRSWRSLASSLGATASSELRFDGSITHLVSGTADPEASSSIHYINHFRHRLRRGVEGPKEEAAANINVVRPEWLNDCQDADGCLDEARYSVFVPLPDSTMRQQLIEAAITKIPSPFRRRGGPFQTSSRAGAASQKRPRLGLNENADGTGTYGRDERPINEDEDEDIVIRLGNRARAGDAGAAGPGGGGALARVISQIVATRPAHGSADGQAHEVTSAEAAKVVPPGVQGSGGGLLSMSRASSFSQAKPARRSLPGRPRNGESAVQHGGDVETTTHADRVDGASSSIAPKCFEGTTVRIEIQDPERVITLAKVLRNAGAAVLLDDQPGTANYSVVPSRYVVEPVVLEEETRGRPVTHHWVEFCLYYDRRVDPDLYFAADPPKVELPLPDAEALKVLLVGFRETGPEHYHACRLIEEIGGSTVDRLRGGVTLTHVLCATEEHRHGGKAVKAAALGVPLVSPEWLRQVRTTGAVVPPCVPVTMPERTASRSGSDSMVSRESLGVGTPHDKKPFRSTSGGGGLQQEGSARDARESAGTVTKATEVEEPLLGCHISCSRSIVTGSMAIEKKAYALGATFYSTPNRATTHLIHRGPQQHPRELKELAPGAVAVHPTWLDRCIAEWAKIDERLCPPTLKADKMLATTIAAPEIEESLGRRIGASQTQRPLGSVGLVGAGHHDAVAKAKPWHRSVSAGTAADGHSSNAATVPAQRSRDDDPRRLGALPEAELAERGRSVSPSRADGSDSAGDMDDLAAPGADDAEGIVNADEQAILRNANILTAERALHQESLEKAAAADQVMALLRSRTLEQSARRRSRQPPRSRKRRSDDGGDLVAGDSAQGSPASTSTAAGPSGSSTVASGRDTTSAERLLALQAEREAQLAAEAAAHGFSLGLDRGSSGTQGREAAFDSSLRVVYDDPTARRERQKLLDLVAREQQRMEDEALASGGDGAQTRSGGKDESETQTERSAEEAEQVRARGFGTGYGRTTRANAEGTGAASSSKARDDGAGARKSESPTKRPVVRRQPLARR